MEFLQSVFENAELPLLSALILGLMTAISPCPLATNITAIGYLSKDLENRRKVFFNGLLYTLGRAISYTSIGLLFFFGASEFKLSAFFQTWGERVIGPVLIIIGLIMLNLINFNIPGSGSLSKRFENKSRTSPFWIILIGIVFALAFCPYSGVLYFGMLIPMTISSAKGLYLPIIFALATGIPVIIISWLIAFSVGSVGYFYKRIKSFEYWFRKIIALVFIVVGLIYLLIYIKL